MKIIKQEIFITVEIKEYRKARVIKARRYSVPSMATYTTSSGLRFRKEIPQVQLSYSFKIKAGRNLVHEIVLYGYGLH